MRKLKFFSASSLWTELWPKLPGMSAQSAWARFGRRWTEQFPWLEAVQWDTGDFSVSCAACKAAGHVSAEFRTIASLQVSHFRDHEKTKRHQAAASNEDIRLRLMAPSLEEFIAVLRATRKGKDGGDDGIAWSGGKILRRRAQLKFCLAESLRARARQTLNAASCVTVHSDCSKTILVLRGQTCAEELRLQHMLLGARKLHDFSAVGVATAVVHLLHDLATPFAVAEQFKDCLKPTVPAQVACPQLDAVAFQQWLGRVEVFNADAAADEQLAGQLLSSEHEAFAQLYCDLADMGTGTLQVFPNLKFVNKDKPHAARRTLFLFVAMRFSPHVLRVYWPFCQHSESHLEV